MKYLYSSESSISKKDKIKQKNQVDKKLARISRTGDWRKVKLHKIESVDSSRSGRGANQAFVLQCVASVCCRVNLVNQLPTLKKLHLFLSQ